MSFLPTWVPDLRLHCCVTHTDWARNATQTALSWSRKCPWMKPNTRLDFATAGAPSRTHSTGPRCEPGAAHGAWLCVCWSWLDYQSGEVWREGSGGSGREGTSRLP